jgi:hypothetical protein
MNQSNQNKFTTNILSPKITEPSEFDFTLLDRQLSPPPSPNLLSSFYQSLSMLTDFPELSLPPLFDDGLNFNNFDFLCADSEKIAENIDNFKDLLKITVDNYNDETNNSPPLSPSHYQPNAFPQVSISDQNHIPSQFSCWDQNSKTLCPLVIPQIIQVKESKKIYRQMKFQIYLAKKYRRIMKIKQKFNVQYSSRQNAASKRRRVRGKFAREYPDYIPVSDFNERHKSFF